MKILLILSYVFAFSLDARAEDNSSNQGDQKVSKQARFMMEDKTNNIGQVGIETQNIDFSWSVLTKNSAANGALPMVGKDSGKSYYQFEDGLSHPILHRQ